MEYGGWGVVKGLTCSFPRRAGWCPSRSARGRRLGLSVPWRTWSRGRFRWRSDRRRPFSAERVGSDHLPPGCYRSADRCGAGPELMVECVLQSCEGADVWQDVAVEDSGDGGMRDTGHVGQSAKRELAGAHGAVQVAGEEQPAVGAQWSVVGQDDLRPVSCMPSPRFPASCCRGDPLCPMCRMYGTPAQTSARPCPAARSQGQPWGR